MEIQRPQSDDWKRLKKLRLEALNDAPQAFGTTSEDARKLAAVDWRKQLDELATFIAVNEWKDVGMVRGAPDETNSTRAFLISMWVAPNVRGLGVGRLLIEAVVKWAGDAGFTRLELDVADDNIPAITLYESMNFLPTGETGSLPPPRTHVLEHRRLLKL